MNAAEQRGLRKYYPAKAVLERTGWYHSFRFADGTEIRGTIPVEKLEYRYSTFPIPEDLSGKRILDIGAWDGWFSFEAERRGAEVTAIDTVAYPNFQELHRRLGSKIDYRELDLFEISAADLGSFDYVFFLGVLYHTKYPVLALELVCALTRDVAIVESYVTDAETWEQNRDAIPTMEFYETDELGGQLDNWFGPTVGCLMAMARTAGFARVEVLHVDGNRAALGCYRKWGPVSTGETSAEPAPRIESVKNNIRGGINFRASREEYLTWWFEHPVGGQPRDNLERSDLRLEVGDFGLPALYVTRAANGLWSASSRLPPGLYPGWYECRMSVDGSPWSEPARIAVDVAGAAERLVVQIVCDGETWARDVVQVTELGGFLSVWVSGLGETSDEANTAVLLDGIALPVTFVGKTDGEGLRQVNAIVPADIARGPHTVAVRYAGVRSEARDLLCDVLHRF